MGEERAYRNAAMLFKGTHKNNPAMNEVIGVYAGYKRTTDHFWQRDT